MNKFLPTIMNTLSNNSQASVSSLIKEIKSSKQDIQSLVSRLNLFKADSKFSPSTFSSFAELNKIVFTDIFRDADLRIRNYYASANLVNLFINSIKDVFSSEIQKIEKDIENLELYIDNYEYISGKDDLFNSNYIEKFDNFMNDYTADNNTIVLTDRDGEFFDTLGNGFIDTRLGIFKIGEKVFNKNLLDCTVSIVNNYDNYITTDTGFDKVLNDVTTDAWSVTAKSPIILTSKLSNYSKYINYSTKYINGAQTVVEISFDAPQTMDSILINPNLSNGLQLLQVVLFEKDFWDINNYSDTYDDTLPNESEFLFREEFGVLSAPRAIDGLTEIMFPKSTVKMVILIFNQPTYIRTENMPVTTEINSKGLYNTAKIIKEIKQKNTDKLQSLVYNLFLKNNSYNQTSKNEYNSIDNYYSYKYPVIDKGFSSMDYQGSYIYEKFDMDTTSVLPSNLISDLFKNIFINSMGDNGQIFEKSVFINSDSNVRSNFNFNKPVFLPVQNSNNVSFSDQTGVESKQPWKKPLLKELLNTEVSNAYEYSFSIKSIDFCEVTPNEKTKACFVSKKINFNGYPLAIKAKVIKNQNEFNLLNSTLDLKYPVSYELSISNKENPSIEEDWLPVCESGVDVIDSEVLFFDQQSFSCKTRFPFKTDTIKIFKNGTIVNPSQYKLNGNNIIITTLERDSIYSCSYTIDLSLYNVDYVDFFRLGLLDETLKSSSGSGNSNETFTGTDALNRIQLAQIPHIDTRNINTAIYSKLVGTVFSGSQQGYSPIKLQMPDGSFAINLTNYTGTKEFPEFPESTDLYYFIQNGKNIIFNKQIDGDITAFYDYLADTIRFRLIIRKNTSDTTFSGAADLVLLKAKTKNYDPYYDKLTKTISTN